MSDRDTINFDQDHELNTVLGNVGARETVANRAMLKLLGDAFKKEKGVRIISDRPAFYEYIKNHASYPCLEKKPAK